MPPTPPRTFCFLEQRVLTPGDSRCLAGQSCKFLGCDVVKYFIEERHGKCALSGKRAKWKGRARGRSPASSSLTKRRPSP